VSDSEIDSSDDDEPKKNSNSEEEGEIKDDETVEEAKVNSATTKSEIDSKKIAQLKKKYQECEINLKKIHKHLKSDAYRISSQSSPTLIEKVKILKRKKHAFEKKYISYKAQLKEILGKSSSDREASENRSHQHRSSRSSLEKAAEPTSSKSPVNSSQINSKVKLPYPVLNDKRDKNIIIDILLDKKVNLEGMLEQTLRTFQNLGKDSNERNQFDEEKEIKARRLKSLEENIRMQLTRLKKQIDYISWSIDLDKIKKKIELDSVQLNPEQIHTLKRKSFELSKQIEHILKYMSDENANVLNQSNDISHGKSPSLSTNKSQTNLIKKDTSENLSMESFYRSNPPPMSQLQKSDNHKTSSNSNNNVQLTTHQAAPSLYKNNFNENDFRDSTKTQFKPNYQGSKYPNEAFQASKVSTPPYPAYPVEEKIVSNKFLNNSNIRTPPLQPPASSSPYGVGGQSNLQANGKNLNEPNKPQQGHFMETSYKNQQVIYSSIFEI
jgi:hypothetical protein